MISCIRHTVESLSGCARPLETQVTRRTDIESDTCTAAGAAVPVYIHYNVPYLPELVVTRYQL